MRKVTVFFVDVDEVTEKKMLLADNKTSDRSTYDSEVLTSILREMHAADALAGTGYDAVDVQALVDAMNGPSPPENFASFDDTLATEHKCPRCGFDF